MTTLPKITAEHVLAARRELSRRSLADFVRLAWPVIEPGQPYVHGPHVDVMCQALERVARGETKRLLLNVPPGTMKSLLVGVFFPMWMWGPQGRPSARFVGVAHEQSLGVRDNLKCRRLASSDWYQKLWGDTVTLTGDQNTKVNFENTATGFRQVATPSNITGRRGDFVILDDPLSAENANSEAEREKVNLWFREALPTRLNNPDSSAIIVVMQRLHERDVSGLILSEKLGYEHLMLPMRFEPDRADPEDWRTDEGELLFPERFSEETVTDLERTLGPYATAGQLQQRPMTDNDITTARPERKETPRVGVNAFIEPTTGIEIDKLDGGSLTLSFQGENWGGVTLYFNSADDLRRVYAVIGGYLG